MDLTNTNDQQSCASLVLPDTLPVMVLSDCYLFPGCFLPLFIFEQRYRDMLAHALSTDRMFCIGTRMSGKGKEPDLLRVSTAGLIHSCVKQADGTSHLILMGLRRVRLSELVQEKPFLLAKVEPLDTVLADPTALRELRDEALDNLPECPAEAAEAIQVLCDKLRSCNHSEMACDILAYHFVRRNETLRAILAEPSVEKRYHLLLAELKSE
ncbi:MAG: LON peptidase substrate-binding domain-containing protein [Verrucomicrobiaceae bacterium]